MKTRAASNAMRAQALGKALAISAIHAQRKHAHLPLPRKKSHIFALAKRMAKLRQESLFVP